MCSRILKESIAYCINNRSTVVYCTSFDATKAFDQVEYCTLFKLFNERNLAHVVDKILFFLVEYLEMVFILIAFLLKMV